MAEVGIHLDDLLGALGQRVFETRDIGGPQSFLAGAMQHVQPARIIQLRAQLVDEPARAIRRIIVHDEDVQLAPGSAQSASTIAAILLASL